MGRGKNGYSECGEKVTGNQHANLLDTVVLNFKFKSKDLPLSQLQSLVKSTIQLYSRIGHNDLLNISVAFEESLLNAQEHGNLELESGWKEDFAAGESTSRFEKTKRERLRMPEYGDRNIEIIVEVAQDKVTITITDDGKGYPVGEICSHAGGKPYGMGLMLIRNLMDNLYFNETGNAITFEKYIQQYENSDR